MEIAISMQIQKIILLLLVVIVGCKNKSNYNDFEKNRFKRIDSLFDISKNNFIGDSVRFSSLKKSKMIIDEIEDDSVKIKLLIQLSYYKLLSKDYKQFRQLNDEILEINSSKSLNLNAALVYEYLGYYSQIKYNLDSAFYFYNKALNIYKHLNNNISEGKTLLSMATIQESVKDYIGSEINAVKTISKLKNSNQYKSLYLAYNLIAVDNKKIGNFDLAIENFQKSISYLKKIKGRHFLEATTLNNIGQVYNKQNEYSKAIKYFNEALKIKELFYSRPKTYAMLMDNLAYSKFKLGQLNEIPELFYKSLKIRDSLNIKDGQVVSNQHLSEYFLYKKDTLKAIQHLNLAKKIAKESSYNEGLLSSYLFLSKIESPEKGVKYLQKYVKLSDSLLQQERNIREKFTRIAYETDKIRLEKEQETKKKWQVIMIFGIVGSFGILFFIYLKQRLKNNQLKFKQEQDKANVEIYNLMLSQQKMFNEGSSKEKNRISKELHDGVLGRLFGTRLILDAINESKTVEDITEREKSIEELKLIEEDIRKISHNLKTSLFDNNASFKILVEQLVAKQSKITKFDYKLSFNKQLNWESISNIIKINCYRILQESIQNINKYAKATRVKIGFSEKKGYLLFEIEDDGVGFNIKKTKSGIGIKNIKSRVKDINGEVIFISELEAGTKIQIKIPILNELK